MTLQTCRWIGVGLAVWLCALVLAACVSAGSTTVTGLPSAANESKDRVTASDESDASKRARVRLDLASAYFGRGQMTVALDEVKLSIAADPGVAAAFNLRGLIYASLGDEKLAEESFRRALQLNARDADSMQNFAWYLCQQKRYAEANGLFEQALAVPQYRDSLRTQLAQGVCLARAGQWAQSEQVLQRAYELDPSNPSTTMNLAEVLYRRGEAERARFYIRRVNGVAEVVNAQTLWLAARIEKKLGNSQGVSEAGEQLRARFPESREAQAYERSQFDD
ncbi:MAG: type IV pilus biogenesis/stability protein PilW [Pseudorhodobacter sp.]|nr:type IV pilus biogenesis/stability protein PilW [Rhizobacter sp.]